MNFFSKSFLLDHSQSIIDFYTPRCCDPAGGFYQNYYDDGALFDNDFRQLVSSTRMVINFCRAATILKQPNLLNLARHGLTYLESQHWLEETNHYAWTRNHNSVLDTTQQAYGYGFVLLCYAHSLQHGLIESDAKIYHVFNLLEARFWQSEQQIYADTLSAEGVLDSYRGQNANMHLCEALIAAYKATQDAQFLQRAQLLAKRFCFDLCDNEHGFIWEHYTPQLTPDLEYNKDDPKNLYRPWGYQPGHQTEWAKLLLQLNAIEKNSNYISKAQHLVNTSFELAWDKKQGGLVYGLSLDLTCCDNDKYFWVQAESFAAAALLYQATADETYLQYYEKTWQYCWQYFVDHKHGAWYRVLNEENIPFNNKKSEAGAKCDYHTLGACFDVLEGIAELS